MRREVVARHVRIVITTRHPTKLSKTYCTAPLLYFHTLHLWFKPPIEARKDVPILTTPKSSFVSPPSS